jgi:hypothetical protein
MLDRRETQGRAERRDAALVAQYIHELSERHAADDQAARNAGDGMPSGTSDGDSADP